jgi:hypothetical protein
MDAKGYMVTEDYDSMEEVTPEEFAKDQAATLALKQPKKDTGAGKRKPTTASQDKKAPTPAPVKAAAPAGKKV